MGKIKDIQIQLMEALEREKMYQASIALLRQENEELEKECKKFRSQAMMRQNAKEMLEEQVKLLQAQLEEAYQ